MKQQNRKTPVVFHIGLVLLCAVLMTTCMMSGLYARYSSTITGSATAQAANIAFQMSNGGQFDYEISEAFNADLGGVYAVIVTFSVTNTGEVVYDYQLNLKLSGVDGASYDTATADAYITLAAPRKLTYVNLIKGKNTMVNQSATDITTTISTFNSGSAYYAVSTDGGTSYTWAAAAVQTGGTAILGEQSLAMGQTHYYKLIYFIQIKPETTFKDMQLFYSVTCEQID